MFGTLAIVGVGLIGGSLGWAVRRRRLAKRVVGFGGPTAALHWAQDRGILDAYTADLASLVQDADAVVVCTPVQHIAECLREAAQHCPAQCLLTDVGSVKSAIVQAVEAALPPERLFVGGHPLAGSEKSGCEHADADMFQGRLVVLTPTPQTRPEALEGVRALWQGVGAQTLCMSPAEHDAAVACTSHVPHVAAAALAASLPSHLVPLAASGFRDTTRIAAGDPHLWTEILLHNREAILAALKVLAGNLEQFVTALAAGNRTQLLQLFEQAKRIRDALGS
jgi:prephenate dehydrogenase